MMFEDDDTDGLTRADIQHMIDRAITRERRLIAEGLRAKASDLAGLGPQAFNALHGIADVLDPDGAM